MLSKEKLEERIGVTIAKADWVLGQAQFFFAWYLVTSLVRGGFGHGWSFGDMETWWGGAQFFMLTTGITEAVLFLALRWAAVRDCKEHLHRFGPTTEDENVADE